MLVGYKRKPKQYKLIFEEEDMEGFECLMKPISVDEFVELESLAKKMMGGGSDEESYNKLFEVLADKVSEWNLEDDNDKLIDPTPENLRKQDLDFPLSILMAWMAALGGVPAPLLTSSQNGEISREDIITQLASSSQSQKS